MMEMEQPGDNAVPGNEVAQNQNDANDNLSELASDDDGDDDFGFTSSDEENVEAEGIENFSSSDDEESFLESEDEEYDPDRFEFLLHERVDCLEYEPVRGVNLLEIPDQMKKLVISGIKELNHTTYTQLMDHFENNTGKIWDRIDLDGHPSDDPQAFSNLLTGCINKTKCLHLFGMYEERFFDILQDGLISTEVLERLEILMNIQVTNQMATCISNCLDANVGSRLLEVRIHGNFMETGSTEILAEGLARSQSLQKLSLARFKFPEHGMEAIFHSLTGNAALKWLNFHTNMGLSDRDLASLGGLLSSPACKLERLQIMLDEKSPNAVAALKLSNLANSITPANLSLKELQLRCWGLTDESQSSLCNLLQNLPSLTSLELSMNHYHDFSILSKNWRHIGTLQKLDIRFNKPMESQDSLQGFQALVGRMVQLKRLWVGRKISVAMLETLVDTVEFHHHHLEKVYYYTDEEDAITAKKWNNLSLRLASIISMNFAGRRHECLEFLDAKLWPYVLERALKISYRDHCTTAVYSQRMMAANVVYDMLHIVFSKRYENV